MSTVKPENWIRADLLATQPYSVPDSAGMVKLDAMENPYRWPQAMKDDWGKMLQDSFVNRYPDPHAHDLVSQIKQTFQVPKDMDVLLGNGSDEIIQMILLSLLGPQRCMLTPEPGFSMFKIISDIVKIGYVGVPIQEDFSLDLNAMLTAIEKHQPAVIFFAYPNNPTGNLFDRATIVAIIEAAPGLVVVDEAYCAFSDDTFIPDLSRFDNLVVMRTLSKIGLAGLRLGILMGAPRWLTEINKVRLPYNINVLTQLTAEFALSHAPELKKQTDKICADRERMLSALKSLPGITTYDSQANFVLFRTKHGQAQKLFAQLKAQGILIKCLDSLPLLQDCLRVTVGTQQENNRFLDALRSALGTA